MKIKYPRFHITEQPTDFYVWYQKDEESKARWSGWIKGEAKLWYKIKNMKKKDQQNLIIGLCLKEA